jgi:aminopeptidase YwaD
VIGFAASPFIQHMTTRTTLFLLLTFIFSSASAQTTAEALRHHVYYLADDSLEGRQSGSKGEQMAFNYIIAQLQKNGITPLDTNDYLQPFPFSPGKELGKKNSLTINGFQYRIREEYYPLSYSSNDSVTAKARYVYYGIQSKKVKRDDFAAAGFQKGEIAIINIGLPELNSKNAKVYNHEFYSLESRITLAEKNGAAAVIFVKKSTDDTDADEWLDGRITPAKIPVIYLRLHVWENLLKEKNLTATVVTEIFKPKKTAHNVVGYIDNNAASTVVIGAHYDHLGYDEYHNSLHKGAPEIHNGADDNASGIAITLELARYLKGASLTNNNYLFIAFSGEELGLLGSKHFVNNPIADLKKVNYMLNFDMVGRLDEKKLLTINGVGTSPQFSVLKNISVDNLMLQTTEGGIGPSDHTSFYLKDIPVLHFFTGIHSDYHKPGDDAAKINFDGMESVMKFSLALIDSLNKAPQIAFTKTKDNVHSSGSTSQSRFKVTLGIVPAYAYEGKGLKVDGVSEGKPAQKAGLRN